jgi:hypothetical protein
VNRRYRRYIRDKLKAKRLRQMPWLVNYPDRIGIYIDTPCRCSCALCREKSMPLPRDLRQFDIGDYECSWF